LSTSAEVLLEDCLRRVRGLLAALLELVAGMRDRELLVDGSPAWARLDVAVQHVVDRADFEPGLLSDGARADVLEHREDAA
jgi:hypothetical protein